MPARLLCRADALPRSSLAPGLCRPTRTSTAAPPFLLQHALCPGAPSGRPGGRAREFLAMRCPFLALCRTPLPFRWQPLPEHPFPLVPHPLWLPTLFVATQRSTSSPLSFILVGRPLPFPQQQSESWNSATRKR